MPLDPDVFALLACVDCDTSLDADFRCTSCGKVPEERDGRPIMVFDKPMRCEVRLTADMTNPDRIDRSVFRTPSAIGQVKGSPYHLDQAHAQKMKTLPTGAVVLETGCGGAQLRKWAQENGLGYVGTDVETGRVHDWLQVHGGADLFCDAHALPFRDGVIDVVYASAVYEHLAYPQQAALEAARVLKPGGLFLGSVSFLEPWHDESYTHMTPNGVHMMLKLAGFEPEAIWSDPSWSGFVAMLKMGNKATMPFALLGRMMNAFYLMPERLKIVLRRGGSHHSEPLYTARAKMSGAISWIAHKPSAEDS